MELKDIYALWDRFEASTVTEMELDFQGVHLKLSQRQTTTDTSVAVPPAAILGQGLQSQPAQAPSQAVDSAKEMKAPLVGVFYRSPAPGEKPFVEKGTSFKKGDVIGIIEAMKMMNEIVASEDGSVSEILVEDGALVEYDQTILTYY